MLEGFTWNMDKYIMGRGFQQEKMLLTREIVEKILQLDPVPPEMDDVNDYILTALKKKDLNYFSFFLHHYEPRLNRFIRGTLAEDADIRYDPEQLMDIKMSCVLVMLKQLQAYDPSKGAKFSTYIHHYVRNVIQDYQMGKESWSFSSLSVYKKVRTAAWMQNNLQNAAQEFAKKYDCDLESAEEYLKEAKAIHSREDYLVTDDSGDVINEAGEDDSWNYVEILWNGIHAEAVQKAFDRLTAEDQYFLEARNAVCMRCGKAAPLSTQPTFDELGAPFRHATANAAEKAYNRAVDRLARNMAENNTIRLVTIRKKEVTRRKKKVAAAIYEYQADCDGEWGEIQFDFEMGTAEITYLADWETTISRVYAKKAIEIIFGAYKEILPKEKTVAFER